MWAEQLLAGKCDMASLATLIEPNTIAAHRDGSPMFRWEATIISKRDGMLGIKSATVIPRDADHLVPEVLDHVLAKSAQLVPPEHQRDLGAILRGMNRYYAATGDYTGMRSSTDAFYSALMDWNTSEEAAPHPSPPRPSVPPNRPRVTAHSEPAKAEYTGLGRQHVLRRKRQVGPELVVDLDDDSSWVVFRQHASAVRQWPEFTPIRVLKCDFAFLDCAFQLRCLETNEEAYVKPVRRDTEGGMSGQRES